MLWRQFARNNDQKVTGKEWRNSEGVSRDDKTPRAIASAVRGRRRRPHHRRRRRSHQRRRRGYRRGHRRRHRHCHPLGGEERKERFIFFPLLASP